MSAAERLVMVPLGRARDPLLEDLIMAEGYRIAYLPSMTEAVAQADPATGEALVLLVGEGASSQAMHAVQDAAEKIPAARFLVIAPASQIKQDGAQLDPSLSERVLWVQGEIGSAENVAAIRGFLRGDGYRWASDLGQHPDDQSLLDASLAKEHHTEVKDLMRFAGDLSKFTELRSMLQEALRRYLDILECEAGSIYLWDENTETLILDAAAGPERDKRIGLRQKLGEGLAGWVAEVGEPILVTDTRRVRKLRRRDCTRYSNFSCIAVPVTNGGQLFGVVCLTMPKNDKPFDPPHLRLAEALSQKLASVIRPLSVLSELRRFSERLLGAFKSSTDMVIEKDSQVHALRALSSSILDSVPLAVIAYDRDLRIRSANLTAREIFGADVSDPARQDGAPLEDRLDLDRAIWRSKLSSVTENARKFRLHRVGYAAGGGKSLLDIHCSPLHDSDGNTLGGILTIQDVTEDVEMEAKLSSAERLALMGKIAAKVAHELNNPLDGIIRFLNLAVRQIGNPAKASEYLEESKKGLLRMSNILSELLTFSRSQYASHRPASLTQVIHQGLAPYEQRAREANIKVQVHAPSNLPICPSSEVWEVFGNVIKNALDAMSENGTITVRAVAEDTRVRLTISDTGPGIPEDIHDKIFEPFFTTKKTGMGTGLGLAVCRDALRRIGGEIRLVPSKQGATFEILIPVVQDLE